MDGKDKDVNNNGKNDQLSNAEVGHDDPSSEAVMVVDINNDDDNSFFSPSLQSNGTLPGAIRVGSHLREDDGATITLDTLGGGLIDGPDAHPQPLDASAVDDDDFERALQQRIGARTVDALAVHKIPSRPSQTQSVAKESASGSRLLKSIALIFCVAVLAVLVAVILGMVGRGDDSLLNDEKNSEQPSVSPTMSDFQLAVELFAPISGASALIDESTPQFRALSWIVFDDPSRLFTRNAISGMTESYSTLLVERYIIALVYFATGGPDNWLVDWEFLTESSVCNWPTIQANEIRRSVKGVRCNDEGLVSHIRLGKN